MQVISAELAVALAVLVLTLILFATRQWRYDLVALFALLAVAVTGIVPFDKVFLGFGHPAVITVAAVLVISRGLINSGVVDSISRWSSRLGDDTTVQILFLTGLVTILSAFMNNVGALAILMPVAIRTAKKSDKSPSLLLMPIAFGSMLGGLITVIGTPANLIIATFREANGYGPFLMFDFAPVGLGVAIAGFLFMSFVGWRLIPQRKGQGNETLPLVEEYVTEVYLPEDSKMDGKRIRDLEAVAEGNVSIVALLRKEQRFSAPSSMRRLRVGDRLIVSGGPDELNTVVDAAGLKIGNMKPEENLLESEDVAVIEAVIAPKSLMVGGTARSLYLHSRYGVNLLGISRQGRRLSARLGNIRLRTGDVLLLQGSREEIHETLSTLDCLPLAERGIRLGQPRQVYLAVGILGGALLVSALALLPVQIAFVIAAVAMVVSGIISTSEAYRSIDWPVIILLGAMIPVGQALEITGGTQLVADTLLNLGGSIPPVAVIVLLMIVTILLSALVNNAATAVLMAPIAAIIAVELGVSIDPFLMAVAIGASTSFLTPIGHQSNTLVMGPGGYRFGDYWKAGLPLQLVTIVVAVPLIMWFWPF